MSIGQRVKQLRLQKAWTQEDLASRVEVNKQTVSLWERDLSVPDYPNRLKIAEVFGVMEPELHVDPALLVSTETRDPIRAMLERFGYTPDDLSKLDEQELETIRKVLDPLIQGLLDKKAPIGKKAGETPKAKSVFIIDDEIKVCHAVAQALRQRGFSVDYAFDGDAALARFVKETERPDLILLDLHMPRMGGVEFLRKLRNINNHCRIIIVTAYPQDVADLDASELKYEGYLEKPLRIEELLAKVEELLE